MMEDTELLELFGSLNEWHSKAVSQLSLICDNKDSDLDLDGAIVKAGSDMALGIRAGVALALSLFETLPLKMEYKSIDCEVHDDG